MRLNVTLYRVMAYITGVVLIVLCVFAIAQAFTDDSAIVNVIGTVHGLLYIVYLIVSYPLTRRLRLPLWPTIAVLLAGTIPVMTFIVEARIRHRYIEPGPGGCHCAFTGRARFVFTPAAPVAHNPRYGLRIPRCARPAGLRPPRRRGARPGELLARVRACRRARLPVPGDRPPGDRGPGARHLPRQDADPGLWPGRPGAQAQPRRTVRCPDRRHRADPGARGPARRLARRPVQPRREGRSGDRAAAGGAAPHQRLGPGVRGVVLGEPAAGHPPCARPPGLHGRLPAGHRRGAVRRPAQPAQPHRPRPRARAP